MTEQTRCLAYELLSVRISTDIEPYHVRLVVAISCGF